MKALFLKENSVDMENQLKMALFMKANSKKISKKAQEKKGGKMVLYMKENIKMELNVVKVNSFGIMVQHMKDNSIIIK